MCVNCQANQRKQEETASNGRPLDMVGSNGLNPPNDHHLKTADLYRTTELPERFKNTGNSITKIIVDEYELIRHQVNISAISLSTSVIFSSVNSF